MAIKELREATSPKANKEILDVSLCFGLESPTGLDVRSHFLAAGSWLPCVRLSSSPRSKLKGHLPRLFYAGSSWYESLSGLLLWRRLTSSILLSPQQGWKLTVARQRPGASLRTGCFIHPTAPGALWPRLTLDTLSVEKWRCKELA